MDKAQVIREIKRLAAENGSAPGRTLFEAVTGIKQSEWYPKLWLRWGEALADAGFTPYQLKSKTSDEIILAKYLELVRQLGHLPVSGEIRVRASADPAFPNHGAFNRFGGKQKLIAAALAHCATDPGWLDVVPLLEAATQTRRPPGESAMRNSVPTGWVYLMKSGKHHKIGRTNSVGRRSRELAIQIPISPTTVHRIETDDPAGVEAYWHNRFAAKRGQGEWFDLSADDVRAFKRWKKLV